jgi:hypothetical protein
MFYNTTNETEKKAFEKVNKSQENRILKWMKMRVEAGTRTDFTSWEIEKELSDILFTSVRRSITDLEKQGKIVYTGGKRMGGRNRNVLIFKLR